jgi:hypothetical protein
MQYYFTVSGIISRRPEVNMHYGNCGQEKSVRSWKGVIVPALPRKRVNGLANQNIAR